MALRPRSAEGVAPSGSTGSAAASGQPSGGLGRVLARAFRAPKPQILVLGPLCGESVVYLAGRGARVHVEEFVPPEPIPPRKPGEEVPRPAAVRLDQPERFFDVVLAWEALDFVPPERLVETGAEISRVMRVGGQLFLLAHQKPPADTAVMPRYRLLADDLIVREEPPGTSRRRYMHPNRDLERALSGLSVQGIQLQRNQMREIVAAKAGIG